LEYAILAALSNCIGAFGGRKVLHGGFAAVQDDIFNVELIIPRRK